VCGNSPSLQDHRLEIAISMLGDVRERRQRRGISQEVLRLRCEAPDGQVAANHDHRNIDAR